jgi:hypothetical protein
VKSWNLQTRDNLWPMSALLTSAPHLRPLLQYVAFGCRDFPLMCDRLSILMNGLYLLHQTKVLTYPIIREHVLKADAPQPSYIYWPPMAWDISIGDVGYIKDTSFIKILNMRDHFEFSVLSPSINYLSASGSFGKADLGEGVIRCVPHQETSKALWIHVSATAGICSRHPFMWSLVALATRGRPKTQNNFATTSSVRPPRSSRSMA